MSNIIKFSKFTDKEDTAPEELIIASAMVPKEDRDMVLKHAKLNFKYGAYFHAIAYALSDAVRTIIEVYNFQAYGFDYRYSPLEYTVFDDGGVCGTFELRVDDRFIIVITATDTLVTKNSLYTNYMSDIWESKADENLKEVHKLGNRPRTLVPNTDSEEPKYSYPPHFYNNLLQHLINKMFYCNGHIELLRPTDPSDDDDLMRNKFIYAYENDSNNLDLKYRTHVVYISIRELTAERRSPVVRFLP